MAEIRRDLVKNNWVAITADMALKPNDFPINRQGMEATVNHQFCPFCEGNESFTPPEIMACRHDGMPANSAGWSIRVIPNKFSSFQLEGVLEKTRSGIYSNFNGVGRQEVIVENPKHNLELHEFDQAKFEQVLQIFRHRINDLSQDERIKYIQIYKNRGIFAGASLSHSHSQIMGLPFVPRGNSGLVDYYSKKGQCLICDILNQEKASGLRIIYESEHFILLCPYASRFSYETWVIPKHHSEHFGAINEVEIADLAMVCKEFTRTMVTSLQDPAYNLVINTSPINVPYQPGFHWYMEITPRLLVTAGVDIATGIFMNPVAPELAAAMYRDKMKK